MRHIDRKIFKEKQKLSPKRKGSPGTTVVWRQIAFFIEHCTFEEDDFGKNEPKYIEEATLDSSDEDSTAVEAAPEAKYSDEETGSGEMVPGAEYCMALLRTDKPTGKNLIKHAFLSKVYVGALGTRISTWTMLFIPTLQLITWRKFST